MKKLLLAILIISLAVFKGEAQVSAVDGMVDYKGGKSKHSSVIELPYPPEVVKNAIKESMEKRGYKEQKSKDIQIFRGVQLDNDNEPSDLHFIVERKSRKEKDISLVHLIVARTSENVEARSATESHKSEKGKAFLNDLVPAVAAHQLEVNIKDQNNLISKTEEKLKDLQKDQVNYEKKLADLQDKIDKNKKEQEVQTSEVAKQRSILEAMESHRGK